MSSDRTCRTSCSRRTRCGHSPSSQRQGRTLAAENPQAWADRLLERLETLRIVPIVEISSPERAGELAAVLEEAGLPLMEITLRTPAAVQAIEIARSRCPNVLVGAGTILDPAGLQAAVAAGASFGVSPGFDPTLSRAAFEAALAYLPGVATASDIQAARLGGHRIVKFFPAEAAGGLAAVKALAAPFGPAGVRFIPTGGIRETTAPEYLAVPQVVAVGGTWIAPRQDIEAGDWEAIRTRAIAARRLAAGA